MKYRKHPWLFAVGVAAMLLCSCGDGKKDLQLTAATIQILHSMNQKTIGRLHVLYTEKDSFNKVQNAGLYFTYFLDAADNSMTMHGWPTKKPFLGGGLKFETADADLVRLEKAGLSTETFGSKIYLSPPFVDKDILKKIKDDTSNKYVVFYPYLYQTNGFGDLIKYRIYLMNVPPTFNNPNVIDTTITYSTMTFMLQPGGYYEANPSPPKQDY